jgi:hypothetical protein
MVGTRRTIITDETFDHIIIALLGIPTLSETYKALVKAGVITAYDLCGIIEKDIQDLVYDTYEADGITILTQDNPIPIHH